MMFLLALLLTADSTFGGAVSGPYANYDNTKWGFLNTRSYEPKCMDIPTDMELCQNLPYTKMRLPNILKHEQIDEALEHSASWTPLIHTECHYAIKNFLCSIFAPVCLERFMLVQPCRSFCLSVKNKCEPVMNRFNFSWPEMFNCNKFPPKKALCMPLPPRPANNRQKVGQTKPVPVCNACRERRPKETVIATFCQVDAAMRVKLRDVDIQSKRIRLIVRRKMKLFKKPRGRSRKQLSRAHVTIERQHQCVCPQLKHDKKYLILGRVRKRELIVSMIIPFKRRNKEFSRVLRMMRQPNVCQRDGIMKAIKGYNSESRRKWKREQSGRRSRRWREFNSSPYRNRHRRRRIYN